ncbi:coatomer subunit delta isoform X1 [Tachypleus tridentatus]|uniref:coatomer subunit delta isoform X1 n=2 Tax=Tachypleus tridentatus TaxID=6853 RepID=UPI003FD4A66A
MVLLAAAICTKPGKAIISRQFVEMSRARIEGLLAAFPKLLSTGRQHTFVETESVRYVYQPLEKLYMLLITTRTSNILEDLETLRLFSRVIPEYCKNMDEEDIIDNSFNLIFAFDEIVALGYRENVNLAQIRTFVEMDSHEEKVYQAVRQTQEREAKQKMKEKARELQRARQEAAKKGRTPGFGSGGFGSGNMGLAPSPVIGDSASTMPEPLPKPSFSAPSRPSGPSKALKLGSKTKDVDLFVDQLKSEGENVATSASAMKQPVLSKTVPPPVHTESVHLHIEEKLTLIALRDGGLQNLEIHGIVTLRIKDDKYGSIRVQMDNKDDKGVQLQTHPNIDKELFKSQLMIGLKNPSKPFPLNTDVGVLKWRFQSQDESYIPLTINCWPSENGTGGCDVNIEYELEQENMELNDVLISISLPSGPSNLIVNECDGEYHHDSRKNVLEWRVPLIDVTNKTGAMEFSCNGGPEDFFPVTVNFYSKTLFCNILVRDVTLVEGSEPVKYSSDAILIVDKFEVV